MAAGQLGAEWRESVSSADMNLVGRGRRQEDIYTSMSSSPAFDLHSLPTCLEAVLAKLPLGPLLKCGFPPSFAIGGPSDAGVAA